MPLHYDIARSQRRLDQLALVIRIASLVALVVGLVALCIFAPHVAMSLFGVIACFSVFFGIIWAWMRAAER